MMLSLILAATMALASPAPAPQSTGYGSYGSLPVIIKVSTSAVCTTLRKTVVPVGFIARHNDAAIADVKALTLKTGVDPLAGDTDFRFLAHHDQSDVAALVSNDNLAQSLIDESRKRFPAEKYSEIEAMRRELEAVIDLQRRYASTIDAISGQYLDSLDNRVLYGGMYGSNTTSVQTRSLLAKQDFINGNRVLLGLAPLDTEPIAGGNADAMQTQNVHDANPFVAPQPSASPGSKEMTDAAHLQSSLDDAENRLKLTALTALRLCNHDSVPTHGRARQNSR